jgi:hypothetical protein
MLSKLHWHRYVSWNGNNHYQWSVCCKTVTMTVSWLWVALWLVKRHTSGKSKPIRERDFKFNWLPLIIMFLNCFRLLSCSLSPSYYMWPRQSRQLQVTALKSGSPASVLVTTRGHGNPTTSKSRRWRQGHRAAWLRPRLLPRRWR